VGIELRARSGSNDAIARFIPHLGIVYAEHINRVECIRNGKDSGFNRNGGSPHSIGISGSIPSFVMMRNDDRGLPEKAVGLKPLSAQSRMRLAGSIGMKI
jgi:hypothetical protein